MGVTFIAVYEHDRPLEIYRMSADGAPIRPNLPATFDPPIFVVEALSPSGWQDRLFVLGLTGLGPDGSANERLEVAGDDSMSYADGSDLFGPPWGGLAFADRAQPASGRGQVLGPVGRASGADELDPVALGMEGVRVKKSARHAPYALHRH